VLRLRLQHGVKLQHQQLVRASPSHPAPRVH
jgi:hypothetical protein